MANIYTNLETAHLLDEGTGSSAADSSGNARTGTAVGSPSWTTGGIVLVQSSGQYVDLSTYAGVSGTGGKSIGVRFKTSNAGVSQYLFGYGNTTASGSTIGLSIESGTIYVRCNGCYGTFGTGVTDGTTHRILVVIPASATMSQVQVYVDGVSRTGTFSNGSTALNTVTTLGTVRIGHYWLSGGNTFDGTIYEAYLWSRALDSTDQALVFAGDYPWVACTPTDLTDNRIYQRSYGTTAKTITFAGRYDNPTAPSSVEVKIVRDGTSTLVQDWTALSSATISGGSYSGSLSVPSSDYWYNYIARIKDSGGTVLATSSQTSNGWTVGELWGCAGQSNMEKMFSVSSTPPTPASTTMMYSGGWTAVTGNGAIRLANLLHTALGCPVGLVAGAVNDTGLVYNAGSGIWQAGSSPYDNFLTAISAVGGDLAGILFHQGEADMKGGTSNAAYQAQLTTLYTGFKAAVTRTTNLYFGLAITGCFQNATATDATCQAIREAQASWIASTGGKTFISGCSLDMVRTDAAHWTAPYYERMARRYAQSILYARGDATYDGVGPSISTAHYYGSTIDLAFDMHNHASLTELDGSTDGGSLTGLEVSADNFATNLTINSTSIISGGLRLAMSAALSGTPKIRNLYGDEPTITNTVHGNRLPQGDTVGPVLQPFNNISITESVANRGFLRSSFIHGQKL